MRLPQRLTAAPVRAKHGPVSAWPSSPSPSWLHVASLKPCHLSLHGPATSSRTARLPAKSQPSYARFTAVTSTSNVVTLRPALPCHPDASLALPGFASNALLRCPPRDMKMDTACFILPVRSGGLLAARDGQPSTDSICSSDRLRSFDVRTSQGH